MTHPIRDRELPEEALTVAPTGDAVTRPELTAPPTGGRRHQRKAHIQAMRALAVLAVIAYHARPGRFSGGFVGVDIFFVISGYLMTQTVSGLAARNLRVGAALREFYIRRATRLLPASLVTLLITCVLVVSLENRLLWRQNFLEALASTGFFENWMLAHYSVDYLGAHANSAFQHYWSLSVEEQFYLVWPIIVLLSTVLVGRTVNRRRIVVLPLAVLTAASLAYSVVETHSDAAIAYFNTGVRFWELSIGGCAFLLTPYLRRIKFGGVWLLAGIALMFGAILKFNATLEFPGVVAAIPVMGAVLVLVFGDFEPTAWPEKAVRRLSAFTPIQWVGDQSYSLYLLHFGAFSIAALTIFRPARQVGTPQLSQPQLAGVLIVVFVSAWLLKTQVEDRFRISRVSSRPTDDVVLDPKRRIGSRATWVFIGVSAAAVVALAGGMYGYINTKYDAASSALAAFKSEDHDACFKAVSTSPSAAGTACPAAHGGHDATTIPSPYIATDDFNIDKCQQAGTRASVITCHFGSTHPSAKRVVLAGDSHATQWVPALDAWGRQYGYAITTYLKAGCPLVVSRAYSGTCAQWNTSVTRRILAQQPAFVLVSARSGASKKAAVYASTGVKAAWAPLLAANLKIIAIHDVPQPDHAGISDMPTCVSEHVNVEACTFKERTATSADIVSLAAQGQRQVRVLDMGGYICQDESCSGVIGGMLAYVDGSHLSATFVTALEGAFSRELNAVLR
jgi:peptidoglycan/LPS O-acetylase OafA/YrhL